MHLGHRADLRDYHLSVEILRFLKVFSLRLMTNNPEKMKALESSNICIVERISAEVHVSPHAARYLATKRQDGSSCWFRYSSSNHARHYERR